MTRDTARPVPFGRGARGVFDLALDGMLLGRRGMLLALLLGLPAAFAIAYRAGLLGSGAQASPAELYAFVVALYYVRNALPLAALFLATALVAEEVEGRTLTYLVTRPISKPAVLLGKFGAYLAATLAATLPALVVSYLALSTAPGSRGLGAGALDLLRDLGVALLALLAYGALFTLLGTLLRRPVLPGLLFLLAWEQLANLPGVLPRLTLTAYLRSLLPYPVAGEGIFGMRLETLSAPLCLTALGASSAVCLAAAAWIFREREYVLEQ